MKRVLFDKNSILFRFTLLFAITCLATGYSIYIIFSNAFIQNEIQLIEEDATQIRIHLKTAFNHLQEDIQFLGNMPLVKEIADSDPASHGDNPLKIEHTRLKQQLEKVFGAMLKAKPEYLKIRFIGVSDHGKELIRVDRQSGSIQTTPPQKLQHKLHRPFVARSMILPPGGIYTSDLNLNQDFGKVVTPHQPVIRMATPIYTSNHKVYGVIVINLLTSELFKKIRSNENRFLNLYLVNEKGEFLLHPDRKQQFQFEFGNPKRIQDDFPLLKTSLETPYPQDRYTVFKPQFQSAFHIQKLFFDPFNHKRFLGVVIEVPFETLMVKNREMQLVGIFVSIFTMSVGIFFAYFLSKQITTPLKKLAFYATRISEGSGRFHFSKWVNSEVKVLVKAFQQMSDKINDKTKKLEENEKRVSSIFQTAMDGILLLDSQGVIEDINVFAEEMVGYEEKVLIGKPIQSIIPDFNTLFFSDRNASEKRNYGQHPVETQACKIDKTCFLAELSVSHFECNGVQQLTVIIRDVSHRKQLEDDLKEVISRYDLVQDLANFGSWDWNMKTNALFWSDLAYEIYQAPKTAQSLTSDDFFDLVHPEDLELLKTRVEKSVEEGEPYQVEHRILLPNGEVRWVLEKGGIQKGEDGSASRFLGIVQDITDQNEFKEQTKLLSHVVEHSPSLLIVTNTQGRIEYVNRKFSDVTGYSLDEAIGKNPNILKSGKTSQRDYQSMWNTILSGHEWHGEVYNKKKNGEPYWARVSISSIRNRMGKITHFIGIQEDITDLKLSEEKHRILYQTMAQGVVYQDSTGKIIDVNASAERLLGLSNRQMMGVDSMDPRWKAIREDGSDYPGEEHPAMVSLRTGKPIKNKLMGVYHPKLNEFRWIIINAIPLFQDGSALPYKVYTTFSDVTDLKRMEEKLTIAKEKAESSTRTKSSFLANMSHEIRTPMNSIIGFIDLVLESDTLSSVNAKLLLTAQKSSKNLLGLINDILDISKLEAGKMDIDLISMNLLNLVDEVVKNFSIKAKSQNILLTVHEFPPDCELIVGDKHRIRQILTNLVGNALKFTQQGSVVISVQNLDDKVLQFSVKDTGIGMTPEQVKSVFQLFSQADQSTARKYGGTGLGTSISKQLVELLGGKIWLESKIDRGTTFYFTLPLVKASEKSWTQAKDEQKGVTAIFQNDSQNLDILLAEDKDENILLASLRLRQFHHHIQIAKNGFEAVEAFKEKEFDIILMDINMPKMDGVGATQKIREIEAETGRAKTPIIALTANLMKEDREKYIKEGMDFVIGKPISFDELFHAISRLAKKKASFETVVSTRSSQKEFKILSQNLPEIDIQKGMDTWQDEVIYAKALKRFASQQRNVPQRLEEHIRKHQWVEADNVSHALKGVAGNLCIPKVMQSAAGVNKYVKGENLEEALKYIKPLQRSLKIVLDSIESIQFENLRDIGIEKAPFDLQEIEQTCVKLKFLYERGELDDTLLRDLLRSIDQSVTESLIRDLEESVTSFDFERSGECLDQVLEELKSKRK